MALNFAGLTTESGRAFLHVRCKCHTIHIARAPVDMLPGSDPAPQSLKQLSSQNSR